MRVDVSHYPFAFAAMEFTWGVEERARNTLITMHYDFVPKFGLLGLLGSLGRYRKKFEETCAQLMENLVRRIHAREWVYHVTVDSILSQKGHDIISVSPETLVEDTAHILRENRIGSVLALEKDGRIAGVVSERDIVRGLSDVGPDVLQHPVSEIMTKKVVVCHPEDNMATVLSLMSGRRIRHLPVMQGEELVGIISIGDVVKTRINELEDESSSLRSYISGRQWLEHHDRFGSELGI
jgi:CBS domain-containing protein